jgi:4-hydroxy-tetrahydrodipicolinate synthase
MHEKFKGTGVAVITPFDKQEKIDEKGLERVINHLIYGGVEYLVILGTTAETATLTKEEKRQVIDIALETIDGRVPFVLGVGGNNTREILETLEYQDFDGIDAVLSVSPYYNKPSQEGIYQHYKVISEKSPRPIILYNVPARTSSNITASTTLRLAKDCPNILGIKEASGDFCQCMTILRDRPEHFLVVSGDDVFSLPLMACGMDGVISVSANGFPREFSDMIRAARRGDYDEARRIHYTLFEAMQLLFSEGNPTGIKALMHIKGLCENILRLPLMAASETLYNKLLLYK